MEFDKGYMYHIYNQGNNHRKLFYTRSNYFFFLNKIKTFVIPYADILAWCLMPNHFHLMVLVHDEDLLIDSSGNSFSTEKTEMNDIGDNLIRKKKDRLIKTISHNSTLRKRTLNESIGIMLRSYTRAINKQEGYSGALFRSRTKSICLDCQKGISPSFILQEGTTHIKIGDSEKEYPKVCFDYIHNNPVKAKMVKNASEWEFSSALDYANLRSGELINKKMGEIYLR